MLNLDKRIDEERCFELFEVDNLIELGMLADLKRQELHPNSEPVTFVVDRNINYTNICSCKCKFCAFYRNKEDGYVLDYQTIKAKIDELVAVGGTQLLLQGGLNKDLPLEYYTNLISNIRRDFPALTIHAFSPPEISFIAKENNISPKELLQELVLYGLSSIPGGGAEILSDEIRTKISPNKISAREWLNIMETAHEIGLSTTATMVFGVGERPEHIIEHLLKIRDLQDKTGKFTAFIPWTFQPKNTELGSGDIYYSSGYDYMKVLAISRIVLDNIPNIQASWVTQGLEVAQLSLSFGANDFGGTMLEENVVKSAGVEYKTTIDEIVKTIKRAGFTAAQRDTAYNIIKTYS
ncbi:MAG: dehypoxanthine futalosine cyclase [Candidatus Melainabacteria bacterium RIFOXYA12_FULL_32_12]|nr:MAG: dehypoxanthine futalosine cyclase [Candidatus Melainabacteria bacterium RIFOXYA2_FULL_32_9]OGI24213.1 MAG: dehypoxanthine futalosine cyclase [Candidatus Melainabacteria bacterium RIFOXYA12_FULL_32_12]